MRYHGSGSQLSECNSMKLSSLDLIRRLELSVSYNALFNQNPMSVGYSGRPGEIGFPGVGMLDIPSGVQYP